MRAAQRYAVGLVLLAWSPSGAAQQANARDWSTETLHAGYLRYLAADADVRTAEAAYWDLQRFANFGRVAMAFDEALLRDPAAEVDFDRYYDRLFREPQLRASVDGIQTLLLGERFQRDAAVEAVAFLQQNPQAALRVLQNPGAGTVEANPLGGIAQYLAQRPELASGLLEQFRGVFDNPLGQSDIVPWWARSTGSTEVADAYAALAQHFQTYPSRFWAWHQRHLALAEDAQARDWIRYWERRIRREAGLRDTYARDMTRALESDTGLARALRTTDASRDLWPPRYAPPPLAAMVGSDATVGSEANGNTSRRAPRADRPSRPSGPSMPSRPALDRPAITPRAPRSPRDD